MKQLLALIFALSATITQAGTYNLVHVTDSASVYGTLDFDYATGTVDGDPTNFSGTVSYGSSHFIGGYDYSADWVWNNTTIAVSNLNCVSIVGGADACSTGTVGSAGTVISESTATTADGFELTYVINNGAFEQTIVHTFEEVVATTPPVLPPTTGAPINPPAATGIPTLPIYGLGTLLVLVTGMASRYLKKK
jgi:hypothetical protein